MDRDLAAWNLGMADAESGGLAGTGRSRDYYDGYDYACAVNFEYMGARREGTSEDGPSEISSASRFTTQLGRLNAALVESQGVTTAVDIGTDAACPVVKKAKP